MQRQKKREKVSSLEYASIPLTICLYIWQISLDCTALCAARTIPYQIIS